MEELERIFMWLSRLPEPDKLTVRLDTAQQLTIVCSDYSGARRIWHLRHRLLPEISGLKLFVNSAHFASYPVQ